MPLMSVHIAPARIRVKHFPPRIRVKHFPPRGRTETSTLADQRERTGDIRSPASRTRLP
jgi:hypothetical protein